MEYIRCVKCSRASHEGGEGVVALCWCLLVLAFLLLLLRLNGSVERELGSRVDSVLGGGHSIGSVSVHTGKVE